MCEIFGRLQSPLGGLGFTYYIQKPHVFPLIRRHSASMRSLHYQAFTKAILRHRNLSTSRVQAMAEDRQTRHIVVYVTVPNKDEGKILANSIVNAKLAACVNQVPGVESTYWWEGKVETDSEVLLIIKTRESLLKELTQHVIKHHKYEVPEVIALPIIGGNPTYLKWLEDSTKNPDEVLNSS